ncbi:MAG TPA: hypothetical protein VGV87_22640, partial [Blastocatellia bacterium]|nr:hypothetical protein [Blastocatellia bacterium]
YHREVDVTAALWANVHSRIQEEKQNEPALLSRVREWLARGFSGPRLSPALAAALVILTIGITVGVMSYLQSGNSAQNQVAREDNQKPEPNTGSDIQPDVAKGTTPPPATPIERDQPKPVIAKKKTPVEVDPNRLVLQAEQKYLAAITILSRDLDSRRRQLDPETRARFDFALAEIDHTIYATQQAVRGNRSDPIALGYLLTAYSKKVEFLRDTARDETDANRPF